MDTITKMKMARKRVLDIAALVNQCSESWGPEFSFKEIKKSLTNSKDYDFTEIPIITIEELKKLDRETLYDFGFGNWDNDLVLIPLWLVGFIDGTETVTSIMNNNKTLNDCDKDTRAGCIAYGFKK